MARIVERLVNTTIGGPAYCVYPNSTTAACPATSTSYTLQTLATTAPSGFVVSGPTTPQTLTTTLARGVSFDATWAVGLHLLQPVTIIEQVNGFSNTLTWSSNAVIL